MTSEKKRAAKAGAKPGTPLKPSARLAAAAGKPSGSRKRGAAPVVDVAPAPDVTAALAVAPVSSASTMLRVGPEKVRFKWLVKSKTEVPLLVGDQLVTHWALQLEAVYEPLSILDGQATVQGNLDNRAFGAGVPKAELSMVLASKAVADTYDVGRAYHSDWTLAVPVVRALYA